METIKLYFWLLMYVAEEQIAIWIMHRMKPCEQKIQLIQKLAQANSNLTIDKDVPLWFYKAISRFTRELSVICRSDTRYWISERNRNNNLTKEMES